MCITLFREVKYLNERITQLETDKDKKLLEALETLKNYLKG